MSFFEEDHDAPSIRSKDAGEHHLPNNSSVGVAVERSKGESQPQDWFFLLKLALFAFVVLAYTIGAVVELVRTGDHTMLDQVFSAALGGFAGLTLDVTRSRGRRRGTQR